MNDDGKLLLKTIRGLITHAWIDGYGFEKENLDKLDEIIISISEVIGDYKDGRFINEKH